VNKTVSLISKPADRCRHVPPSAPVLVRGGESAPRSWLVVARVVRRRVVSGEFNGRLIMPFRCGDEGKGGARATAQRRRRRPGHQRAVQGLVRSDPACRLEGAGDGARQQPSQQGRPLRPEAIGPGPVLLVLAGRRRSVRPWSFAELWARTARLSRSWSLTGRVLSPRPGLIHMTWQRPNAPRPGCSPRRNRWPTSWSSASGASCTS